MRKPKCKIIVSGEDARCQACGASWDDYELAECPRGYKTPPWRAVKGCGPRIIQDTDIWRETCGPGTPPSPREEEWEEREFEALRGRVARDDY